MGNSLAQSTGGVIVGSMADYQRKTGAGLAKSWLQVKAVVVVDISGSMDTRDAGDGHRRVDVAKMELAKLQKQLQGQIAVVEFNYDARWGRDGSLGEPAGGTNLAGALDYVRDWWGPARPACGWSWSATARPTSRRRPWRPPAPCAPRGPDDRRRLRGARPLRGRQAVPARARRAGPGRAADAFLVKSLAQQVTKLLAAPTV